MLNRKWQKNLPPTITHTYPDRQYHELKNSHTTFIPVNCKGTVAGILHERINTYKKLIVYPKQVILRIFLSFPSHSVINDHPLNPENSHTLTHWLHQADEMDFQKECKTAGLHGASSFKTNCLWDYIRLYHVCLCVCMQNQRFIRHHHHLFF